MSLPCLKVGLTGGIGSGKTTVSDMFSSLGVPVIDADEIARDLLAPGTETTSKVIEVFGKEIVSPAGTIDRARLRELVFNNEDTRKELEAIVHPEVRREIARRASTVSTPYCIISIPLLFESGQYDMVDRALVVHTSIENQVAWASARDHVDPDSIRKIIATQMPASDRLQRADDVIENLGDRDSLLTKVRQLDQQYRELAETGQ